MLSKLQRNRSQLDAAIAAQIVKHKLCVVFVVLFSQLIGSDAWSSNDLLAE